MQRTIYSTTIYAVDNYSPIIYDVRVIFTISLHSVRNFFTFSYVPMDIKKLFGENVRRLRTQKKYSQEEFAQKCKVHRTYMGLIERWQANITLENIEKIAKQLGIEPRDLL